MAAAVVDGLEAIEIQITDDVPAIGVPGRFQGGLEPPFEFGSIDQPGQRVMARLVGHLPSQPADLGDIVEDDHTAGLGSFRAAYRRSRQLDRALTLASLRHEQRSASEADAFTFAEALLNRVAQRFPVVLVD